MGAEYLFCHMLDNFNDPDGNIFHLGVAMFDKTEPKGLRIISEEEGLDLSMKAGLRYRLPDGVEIEQLKKFEDFILESQRYMGDGYYDDWKLV